MMQGVAHGLVGSKIVPLEQIEDDECGPQARRCSDRHTYKYHNFSKTMGHIMNKYLLLFALAGLVTLQACNQKTPAAAGDEATTTAAVPAAGDALATSEQRLSYGIAFGLGQRLIADGVPVDVEAFSVGLSDAMAGSEPQLSEEEIAQEMQTYQEQAAAEMEAAQAAIGAVNVESSAAFLAANAAKEGVIVTESGLQYEVITEGTGPNARTRRSSRSALPRYAG